jgi:peptidoglycan lytic transglycosylase G
VTEGPGKQAPAVSDQGGLPAEDNGHGVESWLLPDDAADDAEGEVVAGDVAGSGSYGRQVEAFEPGVDGPAPDEPAPGEPGTGEPGSEEEGYDQADDGAYDAPDGEEDGQYEVVYDDGAYDESVYDEDVDDGSDEFYTEPGHRARGSSQIRRRRRRRLVAALGIVVAVLLVIGVVGFINVSNDIHPGGKPGRPVTVSIPSGASTAKIGDLLAKAHVIHGPLVFELYVKLEGAGPLMPGTYRLPTNETYSKVVYALQQGPPPLVSKVVVPEGFTIRQIAATVGALKGIGISSRSFMEAATSGQVRSPYEPAGTNDLEGFLFPATYPVQQGETADDLVQYMVDTFDHYASELDLTAEAAKLHYSPYQVLKVASIVEREAKFESDRGPIASVIYNRLSLGMPIGAESTLLYGLGDPKGNVNIETPNPYNSLINKGLPPTPISNPGIPSLQAALSPPKTGYLFWVETNPDGKMSYASDQAGFAQLQVECRKVHLC